MRARRSIFVTKDSHRRPVRIDPCRSTFVALALSVCCATSAAQNCAQTSVGITPLDELGTGLYQGFMGGLYPGGANTMPESHLVDGLAQASAVVPRDANGNIDLANGKVVFLSIGMSNCTQEFLRFIQLANPDPLKHPRVQIVDGAQGGQTAAEIQDPDANFWTVVDQRLANANAAHEQVQVIWFKEADAGPTNGFPAYAQTLQAEFIAIMQVLRDKFPNARLCYMASRIYGGYATTPLNPEPYAHEQGFAVKWTIEEQLDGNPALNFDPARGSVEAPWLAWGTYNWADGLDPGADGLTWACADFSSDGTHPSASGRTKVAQRLLTFVRTDPTAASWYLAAPPPVKYGLGTLTSAGARPSIGWTGAPSLALANFRVTFTDAMPGAIALVFSSRAPDLVPFLDGSLYLGVPRVRVALARADANGAASAPVAIGASAVGTTRFYQGYVRQTVIAQTPQAHAIGPAVSDALRVVFRN